MATLSKKVRFFLAQESNYETDPSSSGATGYSPVQLLNAPMPTLDRVMEPTNYAVGRNRNTAPIPAADSTTLNIEMPLIGLSTGSANDTPPAADDAFDHLFEAALGTSADVTGQSIAAGGSSTSLITDSAMSGIAIEDLACVNFSTRCEWRPITDVSTATHTLGWALAGGTPVTNRNAPGFRRWAASGDTDGTGLSGWLEIDGNGFTLLGGRPTSLKISMEAGKMAKVSSTIRFSSQTAQNKASIPGTSQFTNPPIIGTLGSFYWGTTLYSAKSVEIDFGIKAVDVASFNEANGRSAITVVEKRPTIKIEPVWASNWETDYNAATEREVLIQFGSGLLSNSRFSTCAFHAQAAVISKISRVDDGGMVRHQIELTVTDAGIRTGTTAYRQYTFSRA